MKLPSFKRLYSNDYPDDQKSLIDKLSFIINNGIEVLYDALNNKLTFEDNFSSTVAEFLVSVDINGTPKSKTSIKLSTTNKVNGLLVVSAVDVNNNNLYPPGSPFVSFTASSNTLIVNNVKGLTPNRTYRLKVVVLN